MRSRHFLFAETLLVDTPRTPESVMADIRRYLITAFRDGRGDGIVATTPLVTSGIVDSAGVLAVLDWLESHFSIRIADDEVELENFNTIESLGAMVVRKLATLPHAC